MGQSEEEFDSEVDYEKSLGDDTKILPSNIDYLMNIDEMIEEHCKIPKPKNGERARGLCMKFCYFDRELEVYTDEEGVEKAINGYQLGVKNASCAGRAGKYATKKPQNDGTAQPSIMEEETPLP